MLRAMTCLLMLATLVGCKKAAREQLYFPDLKPPLGVGKIEIIKDVSMNKATGGEVTVVTVVEPEVDRDELDRLLKSFYRQVKTRTGFQKGNRSERVDLRFYTTKKAAEAGGDDWLARVERISSTSEETYANKQKAPLLKWAKKALKPAMAPFTKELKVQILADPVKMTLEVNYPFINDDGEGQYVEELTHGKATQAFYGTTRELFEKIEGLKKLTFIGKHKDEVVMKIWMTRDQYAALNMTHTLETQLHAYQGQFVELLMSKQVTEKEVERKTKKRRKKVFREIFARLPKEQVELHKDLQ